MSDLDKNKRNLFLLTSRTFLKPPGPPKTLDKPTRDFSEVKAMEKNEVTMNEPKQIDLINPNEATNLEIKISDLWRKYPE